MLKIGLKHTSKTTVTTEKTAEVMGSGNLPVLATPALVALMENAAMLSVDKTITETQSTVGVHMDIKHLAPSPIDALVEAKAELTAIEGRKLSFTISAYEGDKKIGIATHTRYIIEVEPFLKKM
jgi:predicted thioesterase